jgi:hypothetical protein
MSTRTLTAAEEEMCARCGKQMVAGDTVANVDTPTYDPTLYPYSVADWATAHADCVVALTPPTWVVASTGCPGDQHLDIAGGGEKSYWGEVGPNGTDGRWSWCILSTDDRGNQVVEANGDVATEVEAKAAAESWKPATV